MLLAGLNSSLGFSSIPHIPVSDHDHDHGWPHHHVASDFHQVVLLFNCKKYNTSNMGFQEQILSVQVGYRHLLCERLFARAFFSTLPACALQIGLYTYGSVCSRCNTQKRTVPDCAFIREAPLHAMKKEIVVPPLLTGFEEYRTVHTTVQCELCNQRILQYFDYAHPIYVFLWISNSF
jgi:hypothetical protein